MFAYYDSCEDTKNRLKLHQFFSCHILERTKKSHVDCISHPNLNPSPNSRLKFKSLLPSKIGRIAPPSGWMDEIGGQRLLYANPAFIAPFVALRMFKRGLCLPITTAPRLRPGQWGRRKPKWGPMAARTFPGGERVIFRPTPTSGS